MPHNPILNQAEPATTPTTSIDDITKAIAESTARTVSTIQQSEVGIKETQTAMDVITASISDITAATQITVKARDNADLQAQTATIEAFEIAGGADAQAALISQLTEDNKRVEDILSERVALASTDRGDPGIGIIDNALNKFTLKLTDTRLAAAQAKLANTERQVNNTAASTESIARVNALTKATLNEGTVAANYRIIGAEGDVKAAEQQIKNIHANASVMAAMETASARNVANRVQLFRIEGEVEQRKFAEKQLAFQSEKMEQARKEWEVSLPAARVAAEAAALRLETAKLTNPGDINAAITNNAATIKKFNDVLTIEKQLGDAGQSGQSAAGLAIEPRERIIFGLNQPGATGAKYRKLLEIGSSIQPVLGSTPFEASETLSIVAPSGNFDSTPATRLLDRVATVQVEKYRKDGVPKDDAVIKSDYNTIASDLAKTAASGITAGDTTNMYQAPPMTVLETRAAVADSTLYKRVLSPMAMKETNPQRIMEAAIAGIRSNSISPDEATAGIVTIFTAAVDYNNTMFGGFRRVGLPNQETYKAVLFREPTSFERLKVTTGVILDIIGPIGVIKTATKATKGTEAAVASAVASAVEGLLKTTIVDFMDRTEVSNHIIKLMSTFPKEQVVTPTSTAPATTPQR